MNNEQTERKEKKRNLLILLLLILIVICVGITIWAVFFRDGNAPASLDYPPHGIEAGQLPIEGDNSDKLQSPDGGGAINVTYSADATISLSKGEVSLYYANPNASNQNVAILVMIDDLLVAKSDLITPGHQVNSLALEASAKASLQVGGYKAELVVRAYNPDSGEKAMVDTKGELTLTVTE